MNTIDLSDFQKKELVEFYTKQLLDIDHRRKEVIDLLDKLKGTSQVDESKQLKIVKAPRNSHEYSDRLTWPVKIQFALEQADTLLTARSILDLLVKYEPSLSKNKDTERSSLASISATLSVKAKEGKIFKRYQAHEGTDYLYGLPGWFSNDEPKEMYSPF